MIATKRQTREGIYERALRNYETEAIITVLNKYIIEII